VNDWQADTAEAVEVDVARPSVNDVYMARRKRIVARLCALECGRRLTDAEREAMVAIFREEHAVSSDAAFLARNDDRWEGERWQYKVRGVMAADPHLLYHVLGEG